VLSFPSALRVKVVVGEVLVEPRGVVGRVVDFSDVEKLSELIEEFSMMIGTFELG
jgi:hypothetical protein